MKIKTFELQVGQRFSAFQLFVSIIFHFSFLNKMECSSATSGDTNRDDNRVF